MAATDFAIIIGINDYPDFTQLNGPIEDATRVKEWLSSEKGGNIPEAHIKFVTSEPNPPTPVQKIIDKNLIEIKGQVETKFNKEARRLYFYFSGHGFADDDDDNSLCMADWSKQFRNSAISSRGYLKYLKDIGYFTEIIFFLDCCRTRIVSTIGNPPLISTVKPSLRAGATKSLILYAAEYQNQAYEAQSDSTDMPIVRGHFTKALLKALNGESVDLQGNVTGRTVVDFLISEVPRLANLENQAQDIQIQTTFSDISKVIFTSHRRINPKCKIDIASRKGMIRLQNSTTEIIGNVDAKSKIWEIDLEPGIYLLTETLTDSRIYITVQSGVDTQNFKL